MPLMRLILSGESGLSLLSNWREKRLLFQRAHREKRETTERSGETSARSTAINQNFAPTLPCPNLVNKLPEPICSGFFFIHNYPRTLFNVTFLFLSTSIGVLHTSDFYMYPAFEILLCCDPIPYKL